MTLRAERVAARATTAGVRAMDTRDEMSVKVRADVTARNGAAQLTEIGCLIAAQDSQIPEVWESPFTSTRLEPGVIVTFDTVLKIQIGPNAVPPSVRALCTLKASDAAGQPLTASGEVQISSDLFARTGGVCLPTETAGCLNGFEVSGTYFDPAGRQGAARIIPSSLTPNSVSFFFTDPRQPEFSITIAGCAPNAPPGSTYQIAIRRETPWRYDLLVRAIRTGVVYTSANTLNGIPCEFL